MILRHTATALLGIVSLTGPTLLAAPAHAGAASVSGYANDPNSQIRLGDRYASSELGSATAPVQHMAAIADYEDLKQPVANASVEPGEIAGADDKFGIRGAIKSVENAIIDPDLRVLMFEKGSRVRASFRLMSERLAAIMTRTYSHGGDSESVVLFDELKNLNPSTSLFLGPSGAKTRLEALENSFIEEIGKLEQRLRNPNFSKANRNNERSRLIVHQSSLKSVRQALAGFSTVHRRNMIVNNEDHRVDFPDSYRDHLPDVRRVGASKRTREFGIKPGSGVWVNVNGYVEMFPERFRDLTPDEQSEAVRERARKRGLQPIEKLFMVKSEHDQRTDTRTWDLSAMSEVEKAEFGAQVRKYLLENPEVIVEAINILEQRNAASEAAADKDLVAANADELFNDGYSWVGGNPEGDITLVEFMDYRCGYCRRAAPEVASLLSEDGNIRLIIKELPILGEASVVSARFAIATKQVAGDHAYKQVHDALIEFNGEPSEVTLRRISDELALDSAAIVAAMDSDEVTAEIARTRLLAQKMGISGTPSFVLGTEMLRGFLPADQMQQIVNGVRAEQG